MGAVMIVRHDTAAHWRWMVRSYALTAAAITLRIYLPRSMALHLPFQRAYPAIAWLCWIPNFLAAEAYLLTSRPAINSVPLGTGP